MQRSFRKCPTIFWQLERPKARLIGIIQCLLSIIGFNSTSANIDRSGRASQKSQRLLIWMSAIISSWRFVPTKIKILSEYAPAASSFNCFARRGRYECSLHRSSIVPPIPIIWRTHTLHTETADSAQKSWKVNETCSDIFTCKKIMKKHISLLSAKYIAQAARSCLFTSRCTPFTMPFAS